jgi:WD40 repeat protein
MRWEHGDAPRLLAAGTTNGTLHVMRLVVVPAGDRDRLAQQQLRLEDVLVIEAHRPVAGPQNLQFGSIGLFAEIWSLAWSPDNGTIATCSEDQTTCVWALPGGEKRRTLTGHTTAVTGVDWQLMRRLPAASSSSAVATATTEEEESEWHEVLATCADDRKVMVWNARTWALMHVFDTSEDIHDWHTLTYCALQPRGDKLCCVTQNGAGTLLRPPPAVRFNFAHL